MHAASVNPEPGSNSLKNVYLNSQGNLNPFSELNFNLSFLLLLSFFTQVFWQELHNCASIFCVVQFSMIKCCSRSQLDYYTTFIQKSQYLFLIFFRFFCVFSFCRFLTNFYDCFCAFWRWFCAFYQITQAFITQEGKNSIYFFPKSTATPYFHFYFLHI